MISYKDIKTWFNVTITQKHIFLLFVARVLFEAVFFLWVSLTQESIFSQVFHFKANKESLSSKKRYQKCSNRRPFKISAYFYVKIAENVERFQYFHFETNFLKNENLFQILVVFTWKHLQTQYFHTKFPATSQCLDK